MPSTDPALALSATETETLRDLRSRLTRLPPGKDARRVLGAAFLKACARVGLEPREGAPANPVTIQLVESVAWTADLDALRSLVSILAAINREHPEAYLGLLFSGGGHAVLTRRLVLAGREQARSPES